MAIVALQIDSLGHTFFPEYVMAASDPLGEPQIPEQTTQVVEADVGIRLTTENLLQKLLVLAHAQAPSKPALPTNSGRSQPALLQDGHKVRLGDIILEGAVSEKHAQSPAGEI